jgi:hypothetical protein
MLIERPHADRCHDSGWRGAHDWQADHGCRLTRSQPARHCIAARSSAQHKRSSSWPSAWSETSHSSAGASRRSESRSCVIVQPSTTVESAAPRDSLTTSRQGSGVGRGRVAGTNTSEVFPNRTKRLSGLMPDRSTGWIDNGHRECDRDAEGDQGQENVFEPPEAATACPIR